MADDKTTATEAGSAAPARLPTTGKWIVDVASILGVGVFTHGSHSVRYSGADGTNPLLISGERPIACDSKPR